MKKFLTALLCLFQISSVSHAGLITHTDYTAGSVITSAGQNTNENTVFNEFNGNIESANIKDGTIVSADIAAATIAKSNLAATVLGDISSYRRPVLVYNSATVVNVETGLTGTSGQAAILFPDGSYRTDSTAGRIQCSLAQVAVLSGTAQSGLLSGTVGTNTWYAIYVTKQTDSSTNVVAVATTTLPTQGNYTALNTALGTSGWVYLGLVRVGDGAGGAGTNIAAFTQSGSRTKFKNQTVGGNAYNTGGITLATSASAASQTFTYASGTGNAQIPSNITLGEFKIAWSNAGTGVDVTAQTNANIRHFRNVFGGATSSNGILSTGVTDVALGVIANSVGANGALDIYISSFIDNVLGVGGNPLL